MYRTVIRIMCFINSLETEGETGMRIYNINKFNINF
jgi:hypothetical protein